jgi:hypothetical protein
VFYPVQDDLPTLAWHDIDPLTGRQRYLKETVPAGADAMDEAEKTRTTSSWTGTSNCWMSTSTHDVATRGYIRNHIRPLLGKLILRTYRAHCGGRKYIEHRVARPHECTNKCHPHECKPLSQSSVRQVHCVTVTHSNEHSAGHWITINPLDQAEPPKSVKADPHPPTPEQVAAIVNEAFKDLDWGMLVWLAMTTGARRGELCALRLDLLDLDNAVLSIRTSIGQQGAKT